MLAPEPDDLTRTPQPSWYDRQPVFTCALEILLLAILAPAAACWFGKPQAMQGLMPLLVLLPLLFGLRYGFPAGVAAALGLAGVLLLAAGWRPLTVPAYPKLLAITLLAVGAGAGQFRDRWASQLRQSHARCTYHAARFSRFASGYALLKQSHGQLEQQLSGGAVSLRSLMSSLRHDLPVQAGSAALPLNGMANRFLELVAEAGSFHAAALYEIDEQGIAAAMPLATLGRMAALDAGDPMLREALRCAQVLSVRDSAAQVQMGASAEAGAETDGAAGNPTAMLAMVPLADTFGHVHAVIAVGAMPFVAIQQRTFDVVALLARQLGDMLTSHVVVMDEKKGLTGMRWQLAHELDAAHEAGLQVCVAACRISGADVAARQGIRQCLAQGRATDRAWLCRNREGMAVIIKSMPMVGASAAAAHLERLTATMPHGVLLETHVWEAGSGQTTAQVLNLLCQTLDLQAPASAGKREGARLLRFTAPRRISRAGMLARHAGGAVMGQGRWNRFVADGATAIRAGDDVFARARQAGWSGADPASQSCQIERAS